MEIIKEVKENEWLNLKEKKNIEEFHPSKSILEKIVILEIC